MLSILSPSATKIIPENKNSATFIIEGLYPGYGITIANALRRVLLSSLPGAAIIGVKIKHVDHEFSTIPHVLEDVLTILLNLKRVRFKVHESGSYEATLKATGEKKLTAKDIKLPSELEVANPQTHIATLTNKKAEISISLFIKDGLGYELSQEHADDPMLKEVNALKVDSVFSPVTASSFSIENMRVGRRTDYNRVRLNIQTDGTITPQEAFERSISILISQFQAVQVIETQGKHKAKEEKTEEQKTTKTSDKKTTKTAEPALSGRSSLSHLKLSSRIEKILMKHGVKTISQVAKGTPEDLMKIEGIGEMAVKEIRRKLGKVGFLLSNKKS